MQPELSIVMPCLNEARTLAACIGKAHLFLKEHGISGEIIVADNGSTDGSIDIARNMNARVVTVSTRGYGAALAGGIEAAQGKYVIMGDSDESYDFSALFPFVEKLRAGYDLIVGNRFRGRIIPGAMPPMHRYFGNPFLTAIGREHQGYERSCTCGAYNRWPAADHAAGQASSPPASAPGSPPG